MIKNKVGKNRKKLKNQKGEKLTLLVSKTTDIPKNALCLTDLHCTNTVPHCTGH